MYTARSFFLLLNILPGKISHFILEAYVGSVHNKTGLEKLLETQFSHSIAGGLV